jgi:hypothetical protein
MGRVSVTSTTGNRGFFDGHKPSKIRENLLKIGYFRRYLAVETIPPKIRPIFGGCR